jgi:hypothetical protein
LLFFLCLEDKAGDNTPGLVNRANTLDAPWENLCKQDVCRKALWNMGASRPTKESRARRFVGDGGKNDGDAGTDSRNRSGACHDCRLAVEQCHRSEPRSSGSWNLLLYPLCESGNGGNVIYF